MKNRKGKKGWMTIKIDLEKDYDRLTQDFIIDSLKEACLPDFFHTGYSLLRNREALEEFGSSRGNRQGDPISPYLFVLCMERLSHIISVAVDNNMWKPIQLGRNGPKLSHLAFVWFT